MKKLVEFSVSHPVTTAMFGAALILLGCLGLFRLETALLPDISFPRLTVVTRFADESPSGIEKRVTKPIEEALSGVRGLVKVNSSSAQGVSVVRLVFDWKTDINFAAMESREKLDLIRNSLPQDAQRPVVLKYDPNTSPLMMVACVPKSREDKEIRRFIEKSIKPLFRRIEGVGGVKISGGYLPEIHVNVNPAKLYSVKMTLSDIVQMISRANYNTPAGPLPEGNREVMVRTIGEFKKVSEIGDILITGKEGKGSFRLSLLANTQSGFKDKKSETYFNNTACVGLSIFSESGSNQVSTASRIRSLINDLKSRYERRLDFNIVVDRSKYISNAINDVALAALIGGILAFFVILFFLKSFPESIILALSIPICVAATLFLMFLSGISLNVISLGGLALGLGMTVDSGIVVVENIRKKLDNGESGKKAVIDGASEVASPVFASILTSVAVFLPIVFVSGLSGRLFGQMALTVSFSLLVSVFTALSIIPTALYFILDKMTRKNKNKSIEEIVIEQNSSLIKKTENKKDVWFSFLSRTMKMKKRIVIIAVSVFIISAPVFLILGRGFLPSGKRKTIKVKLLFPADMTLKRKTGVTGKFLRNINALLPGSKSFAEIGIDDNDPTAAASDISPSAAHIVIALNKTEPQSAVKKVMQFFGRRFDVPYTVEADSTLIEGIKAKRKNQLTVNISGDDEDAEKSLSYFLKKIKTLSYVNSISSSSMEKRDELKVVVNRKRSASIGIAVREVASAVRMSLSGDVATKLKRGDKRIDIRVRFSRFFRKGPDDLKRIFLRTSAGALIPLKHLAKFERSKTESRLFRQNGKRNYRFNITMKNDTASSGKDLKKILSHIEKKFNIQVSIEGSSEESQNLEGLLFAFILAVVLVYMVLASQFESFKMPLVVMVSLPLSFIGSFLIFFITGTSINVISSMGMVMLAGIAVNNAIVLYERFENRLKEGLDSNSAAVEAAHSRTRPILMTTFTTLLGLLPLALGGATLQRDLALAVIGGLASSTIFTLVLLPVFFSMTSRRKV